MSHAIGEIRLSFRVSGVASPRSQDHEPAQCKMKLKSEDGEPEAADGEVGTGLWRTGGRCCFGSQAVGGRQAPAQRQQPLGKRKAHRLV
jgi:hypothetical protein